MSKLNESELSRALIQKLIYAAHVEVDGKYYWVRSSSEGKIQCIPVGGGPTVEISLHVNQNTETV